MRLKYDLNVGALYIKLSDQAVARTRELDDNTSVDLDNVGGLVGIEVISYRHPWALWEILEAYSMPDADRSQLLATFPAWHPSVTENGRLSHQRAPDPSPTALDGPTFSVKSPAPTLVPAAA